MSHLPTPNTRRATRPDAKRATRHDIDGIGYLLHLATAPGCAVTHRRRFALEAYEKAAAADIALASEVWFEVAYALAYNTAAPKVTA